MTMCMKLPANRSTDRDSLTTDPPAMRPPGPSNVSWVSPDPVRLADRHLAPLFHQREIQRRPHRLAGPEQPHQPRITIQLVAVALHFLVEESFQAAAFVRAGLEVDDPAHALLVDECAIDYAGHDFAVEHAGQRQFGLGLAEL